MKPLLGIYREKEFSPGRHQSNDFLLLEEIASRLRERNVAVDLLSLEQANGHPAQADMVFSMCQGRPALENLDAWERDGIRIINSPRSALNTHRDRLPPLMNKAGVAFPATQLVETTNGSHPREIDVNGGVWLKRGDVHAAIASDVQWVDSLEKLEEGLADFARRGIDLAAVQAHREGDEIKFHGVADVGFFHWFYSRDARSYNFALHELKELAGRAAAAAGLDVFGGDVIVSPSGELTLIDLNDWPSFAPCREEAASAIAELIMRRVHAN
ncbi:MAG: hypothetical protein M3128_02140 [Verrucomicrobiota bacterium]|nr:hypothetical protein [Verrucomicrobiota bacterium]